MKHSLLFLMLFICVNATANSKVKISQNLVSGIIGCSPSSIAIADYSASSRNPFINSAHTFSATCNDIKYYCSYLYPNPATCVKAMDDVPEKEKTKEEITEEERQIEIWKMEVLNKALKNWEKPASLDGMIDSKIDVKVDNNGKLLNLRWVKPTGVRKIDRSIVKAFKDSSPFLAPPVTTRSFSQIITFPKQ